MSATTYSDPRISWERWLQEDPNGSGSSIDTLTSPGFIAWYCFLALCSLAPCFCCYRYVKHNRQQRLELEHIVEIQMNEAEDSQRAERNVEISRIEANVQLYSEQLMCRQRKTLLRRLYAQRVVSIYKRLHGVFHLYSFLTSVLFENSQQVTAARLVPLCNPDPAATCTETLKSTDESQLDFTSGCSICLDLFIEGDSVMKSVDQTQCWHLFHENCMLPWLLSETDALCPCCRQPFTDQNLSTSALTTSLSSSQAGSETFFDPRPTEAATEGVLVD